MEFCYPSNDFIWFLANKGTIVFRFSSLPDTIRCKTTLQHRNCYPLGVLQGALNRIKINQSWNKLTGSQPRIHWKQFVPDDESISESCLSNFNSATRIDFDASSLKSRSQSQGNTALFVTLMYTLSVPAWISSSTYSSLSRTRWRSSSYKQLFWFWVFDLDELSTVYVHTQPISQLSFINQTLTCLLRFCFHFSRGCKIWCRHMPKIIVWRRSAQTGSSPSKQRSFKLWYEKWNLRDTSPVLHWLTKMFNKIFLKLHYSAFQNFQLHFGLETLLRVAVELCSRYLYNVWQ